MTNYELHRYLENGSVLCQETEIPVNDGVTVPSPYRLDLYGDEKYVELFALRPPRDAGTDVPASRVDTRSASSSPEPAG